MNKLWIREVKWPCQGHTTSTQGTGLEGRLISKPIYPLFVLLEKKKRQTIKGLDWKSYHKNNSKSQSTGKDNGD